MSLPLIIRSDTALTLLKPLGRGLSLDVGDIVKAEVINVAESGKVSLRMTKDNGEKGIITAKSNVPLEEGYTVILKVAGGTGSEIRLQFMGMQDSGGTGQDSAVTEVIRSLLTAPEMQGCGESAADLNAIRELIRSLPQEIHSAYPELETIGQLFPAVEDLTADILKTSVERSGVFLESRLKLAAQGVMQGDILPRLFPGPDLKGLLLRFRQLLKEDGVADVLEPSGYSTTDAINVAGRLIRNIEFFQLNSRMHEMLYTFLPVLWQDLRDGEISFREGRHGRDGSYTCDITLDLESAGRLSVSVTLFGGALSVSFHAERAETVSLLTERTVVLEKRFREAGLPLRVVSVGLRQEINFGDVKPDGFDIRV